MADVSAVPGALPLNLRDQRTQHTTVVDSDSDLLSLGAEDAPLILVGRSGAAPTIPLWLSRSSDLRCLRLLQASEAEDWREPGSGTLVTFTTESLAMSLAQRLDDCQMLRVEPVQDAQLAAGIARALAPGLADDLTAAAMRDPVLWSALHLEQFLGTAIRLTRQESDTAWLSRATLVAEAAASSGVASEHLAWLGGCLADRSGWDAWTSKAPSLRAITSGAPDAFAIHPIWHDYAQALAAQNSGQSPRALVAKLLATGHSSVLIMLYAMADSRLEWIQALMAEGPDGAAVLARCIAWQDEPRARQGCVAAAVAGVADAATVAFLVRELEDKVEPEVLAPALEAVRGLTAGSLATVHSALAGTAAAARVLEGPAFGMSLSTPQAGQGAERGIEAALDTADLLRANLLFQLGRAAEVKGDWQEAATRFRAAWMSAQSAPAYAAAAARALNRAGRHDEAMQLLDSVSNGAGTAPLLVQRAEAYLGLGWTDEAVQTAQTAVASAPVLAAARAAAGHSLESAGRLSEAEAQWEQAAGLQPADAEAHADLGRCRAALGDQALARFNLERALALDSNHSEACKALAALLLRQGETSAALRHLERLTELQPDDAR